MSRLVVCHPVGVSLPLLLERDPYRVTDHLVGFGRKSSYVSARGGRPLQIQLFLPSKGVPRLYCYSADYSTKTMSKPYKSESASGSANFALVTLLVIKSIE